MIGNGKPDQITKIVQKTGYKGKILTDPGLASFKALGLSKKVSGILAPAALISGIKALKEGYRPGRIQGDTLQLGGAVVIGPGPILYYYYRSTQAADHAPVEDILQGCRTEVPL